MDGSDLQEFGYRRGLVLGFTAAEITILLLFLMLLIMGFFLQEFVPEEETQEVNSSDLLLRLESSLPTLPVSNSVDSNRQVQVDSEKLLFLIETFETTKEELTRTETENSYLLESIEFLTNEAENFQVTISEHSEELIEANEKYSRAQNLIAQLQEETFLQREQLEVANSAIEPVSVEEHIRLERIIEDLEQQLKDQEVANSTVESVSVKEQIRLERIIEDLEQQLSDQETQLASLMSSGASDSKGQDSPCWFESVEREDGSIRERPLYLFDIEITDDYIYVVYPWLTDKRNLLNNRETNFEIGEIEHMFVNMNFDLGALEKPLSFDEFIPIFSQFKAHGLNRSIRLDRRCTFWVAVWDHTSVENKQGYQRAHEQTVGQVFNTYRFKEDKWPH